MRLPALIVAVLLVAVALTALPSASALAAPLDSPAPEPDGYCARALDPPSEVDPYTAEIQGWVVYVVLCALQHGAGEADAAACFAAESGVPEGSTACEVTGYLVRSLEDLPTFWFCYPIPFNGMRLCIGVNVADCWLWVSLPLGGCWAEK